MSFLPEFALFTQIAFIDVTLAGDNAMAVGVAAAGLPAEQRRRAIIRGIIVAAILRILFAIFAVQLLHIVGLLVVGGMLLLWVSWKMYEEIRHFQRVHRKKSEPATDGETVGLLAQGQAVIPHKQLHVAVLQIAIADISMSLDNILAVAGVARDHLIPLVFGLTLSVFLMGAAAALVARIVTRYRWVAWIGLAIVLYTALHMIWEGGWDLWRGMAA